MIKVSGLTKYYGADKALDDLSFSITQGEIVGLLGANGAGKSTTMNLMSGCIFPDEGSVIINDISLFKNPKKAKGQIGYLPEIPPLYLNMTVKEYLYFVGALKGLKAIEDFDEISSKTGIDKVVGRLIGNLSKGYRQRVGIAMALIGSPSVIILDEPTVGLDPQQIQEIRSLIKELGQSKIVVVSSHILPEIQEVASRIIMLEKGRLVLDCPADTLTDSSLGYEIIAEGKESEITAILNTLSKILSFEKTSSSENNAYKYKITTKNSYDPRKELFFAFARKNIPILQMNPINKNLEQLFFQNSFKGGAL